MTLTRTVLYYLTATGLKTHTVPAAVGDTTPPDALFTLTNASTANSITVDASTSVAYGSRTITTYRWDWGDGSQPLQTTQPSISHLYSAAGTYTVSLTVVDSGGLTSAPVTHRAVFAVAAPTAQLQVSTSGMTASYTTVGSAAADGTALTYDVNWGDGSTHSTGPNGSHTYALAGPWTVTLTVTDIRGARGTTSTVVTGTTGGGSLSRDATLLPFSSTAPWNTAIGSNAVFGTKDIQWQDLTRGSSAVNVANWTVSVVHVKSTDPVMNLQDHGTDGTNPLSDGTPTARSFVQLADLRAPLNPVIEATGSNPGGDNWTCIIQPDGRRVQEVTGSVTYNASTNTWSAGHASITDLYSDGLNQGRRASNTSNLAGLIRIYDMQKGVIQHALSMCLGADSLGASPHTDKASQYQWPASQVDSAWSAYYGNIPMGALAAIPPATNPEGVDITTIRDSSGKPLTTQGLMLARCLQDYGAYVIARTNISHATLMVEYGGTGVSPLVTAWGILRPYLRIVKNNTPTSVGGGGVPRQPALPPLV